MMQEGTDKIAWVEGVHHKLLTGREGKGREPATTVGQGGVFGVVGILQILIDGILYS